MYRCQVCGASCGPKVPRLVYTVRELVTERFFTANVGGLGGRWVEETREQIQCEIPVCKDCDWKLSHGTSLPALMGETGFMRRYRLAKPTFHPGNQVSHRPTQNEARTALIDSGVPVGAFAPPVQEVSVCDICGADAEGGQVMADTILCRVHAEEARDHTQAIMARKGSNGRGGNPRA